MNGQYKEGDIVLHNWTLIRKLGEGSFGKVYEAERTEFGVTYKAAVKIITIPQNESEIKSARAEGMDEASLSTYFYGMVQNIIQEISLMSQLKGTAHVVSYEDHAVIPNEDGIGWDILIRMEKLTPLLDYMEEREFSRQDVIKLGVDMCRALELCQRYNIIHRDIKPENIFISKTGDFKLGDFGIARTLERTSGSLSKKGTYTYMAPEIYKEERYGSNVDTYSLGIVMYRLLNNNRGPFLPEYPKPISYAAREKAIVKRIGGAELPYPANEQGRLAEIVLKACAYKPRDRYSSPVQMRQELEALVYAGRDESVYEEMPATPGPQQDRRKTSRTAGQSGRHEASVGAGKSYGRASGTRVARNSGGTTSKKKPKVYFWKAAIAAALLAVIVLFLVVFSLQVMEANPAWRQAYEEVITKAMEEFPYYKNSGCSYSLYDIDKDETPELFLKLGTCEADYIFSIYRYARNDAELIADGINGFHATLYGLEDQKAFLINSSQMPHVEIKKYFWSDSEISEELVFEGGVNQFPEFTCTPTYELDDFSGLEWAGNMENNQQVLDNYFVDVDNIIYRIEHEYDAAGNDVKETYYNPDGSVFQWYSYEYDASGDMIKETHYNADGSIAKWYGYKYDSEGIREIEKYGNPDGSWDEREYNTADRMTKKTIYNADGSIDSAVEFEYDEAGNEVKSTFYNADGSFDFAGEYEYDEAGNLVKTTYYNADGSIYSAVEYEHDAAGNLIKEISYNSNGVVSKVKEYDAARNEVKTTYYNADGSISSVEIYDGAGNKLKDILYNLDGVPDGYWIEREYNTSGNCTKGTLYEPDGSISSWTECEYDDGFWREYEYDAAGNLIKEISYNSNGVVSKVKEYGAARNRLSDGFWREYEYDAAGNLIKETYYIPDGIVFQWYSHEYDEAGIEVKTTYYNADGSIRSWSECEYDAAGNLVSETYYNPDGSIRIWYEYEYDAAGNEVKRTCYNADGSVLYVD